MNTEPSIADTVQLFFPPELWHDIIAICSSSSEDDPAVVMLWNDLHPFLNTIPLAIINPPPFVLPVPLTADSFKDSLMNYVRVPGAAAPVFHAVFPCTGIECTELGNRLGWLFFDPWFHEVALAAPAGALPLASVVEPLPRSNTVAAVVHAPPGRPQIWG